MSLFQIALGNLKRRKLKMFFLIIGLMVGVATVVALFSIVEAMRLELGNKLDAFGPNIVITPRYEGLDLGYDGVQGSDVTFDVKLLTSDELSLIRTIPDGASVNIVSPKIVGAVTLGNSKALLVGVEIKNEFAMKPWFSLRELIGVSPGEEMTDLALIKLPEDGIILGYDIATAYQVKTGDVMALNQQGFVVTGILNEMGNAEDGLVYANLPVVQNLLGRTGELSMIEVSGFCNFCPIEDMTSQLSTVLPNANVTALRQQEMFREDTINRFSSFGFALSGVIILIAALVVMTTMLSSVNERTLEIGIFRAIGFRKRHVMEIILMEVLIVSVIAGIVGFVLGSFLAQVAGPILAQGQTAGSSVTEMMSSNPALGQSSNPNLAEMEAFNPWNTAMIIPAILLSVAVSVISSIYPAIKAAKMDPAEALRFI